MRIAIPTDNQVDIVSRTGKAKGFLIFKVENGEITQQNYLPIFIKEHDEEKEHSHRDVVERLGCDIIIAHRLGKHFKRDVQEAGVQFIQTNKKKVMEAMNEYLS